MQTGQGAPLYSTISNVLAAGNMPGLHTAHEAQVESDYRNPYEDDDEMEGLPAYDPRGVIERLAELHPYEGDEMDDSEDERVEVPNGVSSLYKMAVKLDSG